MPGAPILELPVQEIALRLVLATVLGGVIGLERERLEHAAGLRTHAIVALASALMMLVSTYGFADVQGPGQYVGLDPSRVAAQVVSGIGFLGAGVIIFRKNVVRGLTTAASVWAVAGLGLACGGGMFAAAGITAALLLLMQVGLRPLERRVFAHRRGNRLEMRVSQAPGRLAAVEAALSGDGVAAQSLRIRPAADGDEHRVEMDLGPVPAARVPVLLDALRNVDGARLVSYTVGVMRPSSPATGGEEGDADEDDEPGDPDDALHPEASRM